ncbi:putative lrr receptor-like serine/threonine-protein kinase mee39 [Quercus suber]|uniref:Lrr receptor-like serine/threonine-protein kinase mee39 n=1 Tax=Quercus suber TaxID=58331 RepID=A0AAW0KGW2_QUESU
MSNAATKLNVNASTGFFWTPDNGNIVTQYIYLHFAELEKLQPNQTREFNVFLNGDLWLTQPVVPYYLSTTAAYSTTGTTRAEFKLWLNKTETSTLPPILNAIEI